MWRMHTCLTKNSYYYIIFGANFLDKFDLTINYNDYIVQLMDYEITLKNPDEFFSNTMFIDHNDDICLTKADDMFDWEILNNYAVWILDAKYKQVDTNRVAANQNQLKCQSMPQVTKYPGLK